MAKLCAQIACTAVVVQSQPTYSSQPAAELQGLFNINEPWLGADVATSIRIGGNDGCYLWLHGDTFVGNMSNSVREFAAMPRNSVATINVTLDTGVPTSAYNHSLRVNTSDPVHFGFFSPPNGSQWYWPTAGVPIGNDVHVVAMRVENAAPGTLFPFATAGMDVLSISSPAPYDPLSWPVPSISTIDNVNNSFTLGNAVSLGSQSGNASENGFVYLLGAFGPKGQTAMMTRITEASFASHDWSQIQYWTVSDGWQGFAPALPIAPLFDFVPSETTMTFHALIGWYIIIANTFISSSIMIRTAPYPTGPWTDSNNIYPIPAEFLADGAFCYAGKAHPELSAPGAPEIVFSFMCNTPNIAGLANRTDMYVPRLIRTTITVPP